MKSILVRLYPRSWRARYGEEFLDLLEQRPLSPSDVLDILLAAGDARRRERAGWRPAGVSDRAAGRRWGLAAIAGGSLFSLGLLTAVFDDGVRLSDMPSLLLPAVIPVLSAVSVITGITLLLAAIIGLGVDVGRRHTGVVWTSVGLTALALITTIGAFAVMQANALHRTEGGLLYGTFVYFQARWVFGASCLVGIPAATMLYAVATLRAGPTLRLASRIMVVASLAVLGGFVTGGGGLIEGPLREPWWLGLVVVGLAGMAIGWVVLGWTAERDRAAMPRITDANLPTIRTGSGGD